MRALADITLIPAGDVILNLFLFFEGKKNKRLRRKKGKRWRKIINLKERDGER